MSKCALIKECLYNIPTREIVKGTIVEQKWTPLHSFLLKPFAGIKHGMRKLSNNSRNYSNYYYHWYYDHFRS